jgi:uncharacterized protein YecE (DUF72 family)
MPRTRREGHDGLQRGRKSSVRGLSNLLLDAHVEFGRLQPSDLDAVDLTLPADHTLDLHGPTAQHVRVSVGAPLWAARGFVGKIYPRRTPAREFLSHYARQFVTVELNTTWYRSERAQMAQWAETTRAAAPGRFEFCAKLPKTITHDLLLEPASDRPTAAFLDALEAFGDQRGPAWLLTPPGFGPSSLPTLERYLARWAAPLRLAVELREPEWFADVTACTEVVELFRSHRVPWILTDVAGRRDVLHMCRTTDEVFVRFTGNDLHASDLTRLEDWSRRLARWLASGTRHVRFFLHQPTEHLVVELAEHFADCLERHGPPGLAVVRPHRIDPPSGLQQGALF